MKSEKVPSRFNYATPEMDKAMTLKYLREAWRRCTNCKSKPHMHFIHMYSPIFNDGLVRCGFCSEYLGMWDSELHAVIPNERQT